MPSTVVGIIYSLSTLVYYNIYLYLNIDRPWPPAGLNSYIREILTCSDTLEDKFPGLISGTRTEDWGTIIKLLGYMNFNY